MDLQKYLDAYKLFRITGRAYIIVIGNMIYAIDEGFNGFYMMQLLDNEILPYSSIIAQTTDAINEEYLYDPRVYNMIYPYIQKYTNPALSFIPLGDTYVDDVRDMKASDKGGIKIFHEVNDISNTYMLPIFYKMYPVVKSDIVSNDICVVNNYEYIVRSTIHKKQQKRDIVIFRRFINIGGSI